MNREDGMTGLNKKPHIFVRSKSGATHLSLRLSRSAWRNVLVVGVLAGALLTAAPWLVRRVGGASDGAIGSVYALPAGPWGRLTAQPILIEAPAALLSPNFRLGDDRWYFPATSGGEIEALLRQAGVSAAEMAVLLPMVQPVEGRPGLRAVSPPSDLVLSLRPEVRTALYEKLSGVPENFAQVEPFRITETYLDDWLDADVLPPEVIAGVKRLLWRRGNAVMFSDYNVLADGLTSPAVKLTLLKQLTRKASMVIRLEVPGGEEQIEPLVRYWGFGGRADKVRPLLRSLAQSGGAQLDISNLLPIFARQRLYRFPDPLPGSDLGPGCHWSAFNFFNTGPTDESLHMPEGVEQVLRGNYVPATGEPRFGDIILLTLPDGSSIHSAVYIADGIVYTKNGPSLATPYLFSTMEDMLAFYPSSERITLNYYRRAGT